MTETFAGRATVAVSPAEAFVYVSDVANMHEWVDAVIENDADGDPRLNQEFDCLSSFMGLKLRGRQQVLAFEPGKHFAWGTEKPFYSRFDVIIESSSAGAELSLTAEMETKGIPGGALVVRRSAKKAIAGMAANLENRLG